MFSLLLNSTQKPCTLMRMSGNKHGKAKKESYLFLRKFINGKRAMRWLKPILLILGIFIVTWGVAYLLYTNIKPIRLAFATDVGGEIKTDTEWKLADSPFAVTSDITITTDATLTIDPGVMIYFDGGYGIVVSSGHIVASGTAENGIEFTSTGIDLMAPGQWNSIVVQGTGSSGVFEYVTFQNGGGTGQATLRNQDSTLEVDHCTFDFNYMGVSTSGAESATTIANSNFTNYILPMAITPEANVTLGAGNVLGDTGLSGTYKGISLVEDISGTSYGVPACGSSTYTILPRDIGAYENIPYVVPRNLDGDPMTLSVGDSIPSSCDVNVEHGVIIKLDGGTINIVGAKVYAAGQMSSPVIFTSAKDDLAGGDTNNDGDISVPTAGDWESIILNTNAVIDDSQFEYSVFSYGGASGALQLNGESADVFKSAFHQNELGIYANKHDDTWMDDKVIATNFTGNTLAFSSTTGHWVDIPNNWWGAADGPSDALPPDGTCGDGECNNGSGDIVADYLRYASYSDEALNVLEPPSYVNDGSGADVDFISSTTDFAANWEPVGSVLFYTYCIGTTINNCDEVDWTSSGTSALLNRSDLTLTGGETYYVCVRAWNYFGPSTIAVSDGFTVDLEPPGTPSSLAQTVFGLTDDIPYGTVISENRLTMRFQLVSETGGSVYVYPQVEVAEYGHGFTGTETVEGSAVAVPVGLPIVWPEVAVSVTSLESGKNYHWQARVRDDAGNYSDWVAFAPVVYPGVETFDFGVSVPNQMLIVAAGESLVEGDGRAGTPAVQTAGIRSGTFRVYVVDGNYQIISDYDTTVGLTTDDLYPAKLSSNNIAINNGVGTFNVIFYTATSAGWRITAEDNEAVFADSQSSPIAVVAGMVSANSTVTISPSEVYADGIEQATILIIVLDMYGNPVAGYTPSISADGAECILVSAPATTTDGVTRAFLASTYPGTKYVAVYFGSPEPIQSEYEVVFYDTAIAPESVRDGLTGDSDAQLSTDTLSGNWEAVADTHLSGYEFALTTDPSEEDILSWTDVSQNLQYTANDLELVLNQVYYAKVRSYNTIGVRSPAVISDGIVVFDIEDLPPVDDDAPGPFETGIVAAIDATSRYIDDGGAAIPAVNTAIGIAATALPVFISSIGLGVTEGFALLAQQGGFWQTVFGAPFGFIRYSKRKKVPWNTVYDAETKKPLVFAVIRLLSTDERVKNTMVTDELGRFTYLPPAFDYKLEAAMAGYVFPSTTVTGAQDDPYGKVYRREVLSAGAVSSGLALPLDKMKLSRKRPLHVNVVGVVGQILFFAGFAWSMYCVLTAPVWYNFVVIGLYLLVSTHIATSYIRKARSFGVIRNSITMKPLKAVTIYLVNGVTNQVVDNRLTDETGRYQFFVNEGEYILKIIHPAFITTEKTISVKAAGKLINENFTLDKNTKKTVSGRKATSKSKLVSKE